MKTLKTTTKSKAERLMIDSLFTAGRTLHKEKLCAGKYRAGSFPAGTEIEVPDSVLAVWRETKRDESGPFAALYCLSAPKNLV